MIGTVVFDIDDTLYLERDYVRSGFNAVDEWMASDRGVDGFFERAWLAFSSGVRGRIFDQALTELGVDEPSLVPMLVSIYRAHRPSIMLLPDARACLDEMFAVVSLACVTDGPGESQRAKATALGLSRWLDPVVLTDEIGDGFSKPHRRPFEMIEQRTAARGRCVYVADNPRKDFVGPKALGWRTIRVRRPGGLHTELPSESDVDEEVLDLTGLAESLGYPTEIGA